MESITNKCCLSEDDVALADCLPKFHYFRLIPPCVDTPMLKGQLESVEKGNSTYFRQGVARNAAPDLSPPGLPSQNQICICALVLAK